MTNVSVNRHRIIIEGFGCGKNPSIEDIYNFFEQLTKRINMRILVPPMIVRVPVINCVDSIETNDVGVSGQMIWLESGCQIHTWPEEKFVALDVFSCKSFSDDETINIFKEYFNPEKVHVLKPVFLREE